MTCHVTDRSHTQNIYQRKNSNEFDSQNEKKMIKWQWTSKWTSEEKHWIQLRGIPKKFPSRSNVHIGAPNLLLIFMCVTPAADKRIWRSALPIVYGWILLSFLHSLLHWWGLNCWIALFWDLWPDVDSYMPYTSTVPQYNWTTAEYVFYFMLKIMLLNLESFDFRYLFSSSFQSCEFLIQIIIIRENIISTYIYIPFISICSLCSELKKKINHFDLSTCSYVLLWGWRHLLRHQSRHAFFFSSSLTRIHFHHKRQSFGFVCAANVKAMDDYYLASIMRSKHQGHT